MMDNKKKRWRKVPDEKWNEIVARMKAKEARGGIPDMKSTIDTKKQCFKMFDGAAKLTFMKMSTPDMKELIGVLTEEIKYREEDKQ